MACPSFKSNAPKGSTATILVNVGDWFSSGSESLARTKAPKSIASALAMVNESSSAIGGLSGGGSS